MSRKSLTRYVCLTLICAVLGGLVSGATEAAITWLTS